MAPVVTSFCSEHLPAALALWEQTPGIKLSEDDLPAALERFLQRNPGLSSVAWDEETGELLGTVLCGQDGRRGYLHHVAVAKLARRAGLGRALVERSLAALAECGIHKCHAFVVRSNPYADLFWGRLGWEQRDDVHVYSGNVLSPGEH